MFMNELIGLNLVTISDLSDLSRPSVVCDNISKIADDGKCLGSIFGLFDCAIPFPEISRK